MCARGPRKSVAGDDEPRPQPENREHPQPDEHHAPAETCHRESAEQRPEHRADALTGADDAVRAATLVLDGLRRDDQLPARKHDALTQAKQQTQHENRRESRHETQ